MKCDWKTCNLHNFLKIWTTCYLNNVMNLIPPFSFPLWKHRASWWYCIAVNHKERNQLPHRSHSTSCRKLPLLLDCMDQWHFFMYWWIKPFLFHSLTVHVIIILFLHRSSFTDVFLCRSIDIECRSLVHSCVPASKCTESSLLLS